MAQPTRCDRLSWLSEAEAGPPEEKTMAKKAKGGKKKAAKKR